ncbi:hypothetical protein GCM10009737_31070 [Nocardioides lentus]|uniref:Lipoprotein n=1 Tax=Nocardioides lentus TaxID=338077 RepID=A0ABP5AZM9_9ACTN
MTSSATTTSLTRRTRAALGLLLAGTVLATSSCGVAQDVGGYASGLVGGGGAAAEAAPSPAAADPIDSELTRDGTTQVHTALRGVDDLDVVLTMYPTARTPRTHEWFPKGGKYLTFTLQAFDTARGERDPFATKREVYLDRIRVTSAVVGDGDRAGDAGRPPYRLDAQARDVTLDPEPTATRRGMLITSPKGSFELQDQRLGSVPRGTRGIELTVTGTVYVETVAGSDDYLRRTVTAEVPIGIFDSAERTVSDPVTRD